jgi:hypothetical protein
MAYRQEILNTPLVEKNNGSARNLPSNGKMSGKTSVPPSRSRKPSVNWEISMEGMMKRMLQELKKEIVDEIPGECAKVTSVIYFI